MRPSGQWLLPATLGLWGIGGVLVQDYTGKLRLSFVADHSMQLPTPPPSLRSEKISIECLKKTTWAIEPAINLFYSSGLSAVPGNSINMQQIEALYMKYRGTDPGLV